MFAAGFGVAGLAVGVACLWLGLSLWQAVIFGVVVGGMIVVAADYLSWREGDRRPPGEE